VRYPAHNQALQRPVEVKRRGKLVGVLLVTISAFLISGIFIVYAQVRSPGITPSATPALTTNEQQAQSLVQDYYADWNKGEYMTAYSLLSSTYQSQHSYASLQKSYVNTKKVIITINHVSSLSDGSIEVDITDNATEEDTPGTLTSHKYSGYFIVKQENGTWKLEPHFKY
jgi:hypothetical protein